jgi:hypothetical protein
VHPFYRSASEEDEDVGGRVPEGSQIGKLADSAAQRRSAQLGRGLLSLECRDSITFVCMGDSPRNTKEKTIMTLRSASSGGRVRDALSGTPKVAIVTGASSGIGHIHSSHNAVQLGVAKARPVRKLHRAQEKREGCGFF